MDITDLVSSVGTTAEASGNETRSALGREDFLKMLIAQLENQDPLDPMEGTEFTAQLATFSMLEELIGIRNGIGRLEGSVQDPTPAPPTDPAPEVTP